MNRFFRLVSENRKRVLVTGIVAAAVIVIAVLVWMLREYSSYTAVSSWTCTRESNDQYVSFNGKIVQYGGDGITCYASDGSSLWSKSYEMEQPILCVSGKYLAVADRGGSEIYLFSQSGFLLEIDTPYPVIQLELAQNGTCAAILEASDACRIMLYDKGGSILVEGEAHLDDSGYPAAAALSADGSVLAVSYLHVSDGQLSSTLSFYDFSAAESGTAQAAVSDTYEGETIVRLAYLDGTFAAFGDAAVRLYAGGSTPSLKKEITLTAEAQSIVIGENRFAVVTEADAEETENAQDYASGDASASSVCAVDVYGKNGTRICHAVISDDYDTLSFLENGQLAVITTDSCAIISSLGRTRFSCTFDETFCGVFSAGSGYTFLFTDRAERVRLK